MAALTDLISKVQDAELRKKLQEEAKRLSKLKKFGLVFEEHIPECTPLWEIPVKRGSLVSRKSQCLQDTFVVQHIEAGNAVCFNEQTKKTETIPVAELVSVARFGQPVYPCLTQLDSVCNAPESELWHTLIEADNYHALQLLEYLYAGKVDCIYIDPPYNTGAKDWKYNNDYVDAADTYRHSKWLSMMEKRLKLAKKLLNPQNSVLIVTIDEKEYLHLGCMLEELFPEARIQMITTVISAKGVVRTGQFSRVEEYLFVVEFGESTLSPFETNMLDSEVKKEVNRDIEWLGFRRRAPQAIRTSRPNQFYPIIVDAQTGHIRSIGDVIAHEVDRHSVNIPEGCVGLWPLSKTGEERLWSLTPESARQNFEQGYLKVKNWDPGTSTGTVYYLASGTIDDIRTGKAIVSGYDRDGSVIASYHISGTTPPKRVWNVKTHNAETFGTSILQSMIGNRFSYPKSVYAVHDMLRFYVINKPNALIIDFFAGSGTTLHAVNLLNAEDGGHRRCIMVTNNEVSAEEAETLTAQGHHPGEPEWEKYGIARYVNWPRTVCSIQGHDVKGNPLTGEYLTTQKQTKELNRKINQIAINGDALSLEAKKSIVALLKEKIPQKVLTQNSHYVLSEDYTASIIFDSGFVDEWLEQLPENPQVEEIYIVTETKRAFNHLKEEVLAAMPPLTKEEPVTLPMAKGFKANAVFFKLGFLDKNAVALGRQFAEMLPTLWMKAGAYGPCPVLPDNNVPDVLILPENHFAVLTEETSFPKLLDAAAEQPKLETIYIITDYEAGFQRMSQALPERVCYQLYRDYLDNFRINTVRQ